MGNSRNSREDSDNTDTPESRRAVLAGVGTLTMLGLAGCLSSAEGTNHSQQGSPTDSTLTTGAEACRTEQSATAGTAGGSGFVDESTQQVGLVYGETAVVSNGVEVTAHGVTIEQQLGEETPEERDAYALVHLEAVNNGSDQAALPESTHPGVELIFRDQQVSPAINSAAFRESEYEPYEGDEVQPGIRREGHILYEVDSGLTQADIDFLWQDSAFVASDLQGDIDVRWSDGKVDE